MSDGTDDLHHRRGLVDLHHRYGGWLRRSLAKRYGSDEADDIGQEIWLRLILYRAADEIRYPKALLLRIASNLVSDRAASRIRHAKLVVETRQLNCADAASGSQFNDVLAKQIVLGLPQPLRDVFVLSRFGGLTNSQIAEQLGISPKTVEWRMTKALAHCAAQLRD